MRRITCILLLLLLSVAAFGQSQKDKRYHDYIATYKDLAIEQMLKYNIPASITLAQGLLESSAGYSELATIGNNHFGIKCHNGWRGRTMYRDDDAKNDCFRVYKNPRESYEDHSIFLSTGQRYASLFKLKRTDYKGWARGLKAAGYATNPQYANSLIDIIERYNLAQYDKATRYNKHATRHEPSAPIDTPEANMHAIYMNNRNFYVVARQGDDFKSLSRELGIAYGKLAKYNERDKRDTLDEGEIVYLAKKRSKADKSLKNKPHIVQPGESMYSIAQKYGIQLKALYKLNNLTPDYTISAGDALRVY
ncbi:MAG: glucosaminidase domain-containing protein [Prevotella sp.]|nr:glucosaminidase domain-containing protein [Prevotella sp.]